MKMGHGNGKMPIRILKGGQGDWQKGGRELSELHAKAAYIRERLEIIIDMVPLTSTQKGMSS